MKDFEELLNSKREETLMVEAPEEMEECMRSALNKRKKHVSRSAIAAALIAVLLFAYSFDGLAYYGKKFIGYDNVAHGSLKNLNDEGRGQEINKSCSFSNGIEVTLDGILFDDNELVAFYKIKSKSEKLDYSKHNLFMFIDGIKPRKYLQKGGEGELIDDYNGVWITSFGAPAFYEKWMNLNLLLRVGNTTEEKSISFTLDRNKAMKKTVEKKLDAKVRVGDYEVYFDKLTASSLSTYVNGEMKVLTENAKDEFEGDIEAKNAYQAPHLEYDIVTDKGETVNLSGGNVWGTSTGISFSKNGDALPEEFNSLEIKNIRLESYKSINKSFDISYKTKDLKVDDDVFIKEIYFEGNETCVVISSRGVPVFGLFSGEDQIKILNSEQYKNDPISEEPVERTFRFTGKSQDIRFKIKCTKNSIYTDETISIPVD